MAARDLAIPALLTVCMLPDKKRGSGIEIMKNTRKNLLKCVSSLIINLQICT